MATPADTTGLQALADSGKIKPDTLVALVGKTEGTGAHDDWGRVWADVVLREWTGKFLGIPASDPAWAALAPTDRREQTLQALRELLLAESQRGPLVVVFEDLHWVDGETQALLDSVVESLGSARLLLLVNYRPEYTHR